MVARFSFFLIFPGSLYSNIDFSNHCLHSLRTTPSVIDGDSHPFSLSGRRDGRSSTLRIPEDLATFCADLNIPHPEVTRCDPLPLLPTDGQPWQMVQRQKHRCPVNSTSSRFLEQLLVPELLWGNSSLI